jgi:hypothetical protein
MNLKTVIALAIAAAFAAPVAAQTSSGTDNRVTGGTNASDRPANSARPSTDAATGSSVTSGSNAADRPANTPKSETPSVQPETPRAAAGGTAAASGFSALDRNNDGYLSREEARDASWSNRFTEFDKDNDGRLSRSEFDAMQAAAGGSAEIRSGSGASTTGGMGGSVGPGGTQSGSSTSGIGDKPGQKQ